MQQLFSDDPIKSADDDDLKRDGFAKRSTVLLNRVREQSDSAVLGLIGPWGSGKSSIVELIELEVRDADQWTIGHFSPWSFAHYEAAATGFFAELRDCLPDDQKWSTTRQTLGQIGAKVAPLGAITGLLGFGADKIAEKAAEMIGGDASPTALRTKAAQALKDLEKPILMILDDLDRLEPTELLSTFRLIRLVGRLPNVYYLAAYDETTLLDVLKSTDLVGEDDGRAQDYLEKMVQIRLDVPPLLQRQATRLFNEGLNQIAESYELTLTDDDTARLSQAFFGNMEKWLTTPRAIKRFLGQVDAFYGMTEDEVNFVDFMLMTFVRTFEPKLYWRLFALQAELTHPASKDKTLPKIKEQWHERVSQIVGADNETAMIEILAQMFIPIQSAEQNMSYGYAYYQHAGTRKGVGSPDYFNRYYHYGVPEGDVADREVARLVAELSGEDHAGAVDALKAALDLEPELVRSKLDNLEEQDLLEPTAALAFLAASYGSMPALVGTFKTSLDFWAISLGRRLLAKAIATNYESTVELQTGLVTAGDSQLEFVAALLDAGSGDVADADKWRSDVVDPVIGRIQTRLRSAIDEAVADVPDHVFDLLWRWKHLGNEADVTEFLWKEAIDSGKWELTDILPHLVTTATGYGAGRPTKSIGSFDTTSVNNLLGLERLTNALSAELDDAESAPSVERHAAPTPENKKRYAIQSLVDWRKQRSEEQTPVEADEG